MALYLIVQWPVTQDARFRCLVNFAGFQQFRVKSNSIFFSDSNPGRKSFISFFQDFGDPEKKLNFCYYCFYICKNAVVPQWNAFVTFQLVAKLKTELNHSTHDHIDTETTLRHENNRLETEIQTMIDHYDSEMFRRHNDIERISAEYADEKEASFERMESSISDFLRNAISCVF